MGASCTEWDSHVHPTVLAPQQTNPFGPVNVAQTLDSSSNYQTEQSSTQLRWQLQHLVLSVSIATACSRGLLNCRPCPPISFCQLSWFFSLAFGHNVVVRKRVLTSGKVVMPCRAHCTQMSSSPAHHLAQDGLTATRSSLITMWAAFQRICHST